MISIENFYWVLYQNLLQPCALDCWYYYPWGTRNYLSRSGEFKVGMPKQEHHVLFHFDQEPLWNEDLGEAYDRSESPAPWSMRTAKLLANSEHSSIKQKICQQRSMLDWYFFYHGFAALHWFRDAQFIRLDDHPVRAFCSYNHLVTDLRAYRMALTARLLYHDLCRHGVVSFHASAQQCESEIASENSLLSLHDKTLINRYLVGDTKLPMILDKQVVNGSHSAVFGHQEYKFWQRSFVHVVNETVFYHDKLHLTEKIFKPIVAQRPFILVGSPGNLAYLRSYGFKTFGSWIDESYDDIQDPDQRLDRIVEEIMKLCMLSPKQLGQMHKDMQGILQYNKQHFFTNFREIIITEMLENFDQCIRLWNNGRMDDRALPLHPDLASVHQLLGG